MYQVVVCEVSVCDVLVWCGVVVVWCLWCGVVYDDVTVVFILSQSLINDTDYCFHVMHSYFTSTNATHLENEEIADSTNRIDFDENKNEKAIIPDMPSLPTWNDSEKQSTFEEEKQNENSPTDSASMNFPTLASRPGKILSNALDITDRTSELTFEDDKKPSDYNGSSSSVTKKPRKVLKLQNGSKTAPLSTAGTPLSGLNKFIYKPSCKNNPKDDKEIISVVDSQEVIDSGYLSDGEESTDTDTPLRRKESHKVRNGLLINNNDNAITVEPR